jgi:hypothetical protein
MTGLQTECATTSDQDTDGFGGDGSLARTVHDRVAVRPSLSNLWSERSFIGVDGEVHASGLAALRVTAAKVSGIHPSGDSQPVLCVDVQAQEADVTLSEAPRDAMDVVVVIDTSGSMTNSMADVRETCHMVFQTLEAQDCISLVRFSSDASTLLPLSPKESVEGFSDMRAASSWRRHKY